MEQQVQPATVEENKPVEEKRKHTTFYPSLIVSEMLDCLHYFTIPRRQNNVLNLAVIHLFWDFTRSAKLDYLFSEVWEEQRQAYKLENFCEAAFNVFLENRSERLRWLKPGELCEMDFFEKSLELFLKRRKLKAPQSITP